MRRFTISTSALVLVGAGLTAGLMGASPSSAIGGPPPLLLGVSTSAPTPVLAAGVIKAPFGATVAPVTDATVTAWWIPGLDTAQVGDELPIEIVGADQTNSYGQYSIWATPTAAMQQAADANGGWLNLEIGVVSPTAQLSDATSISRLVSTTSTSTGLRAGWSVPAGQAATVGSADADQEIADATAADGDVTEFPLGTQATGTLTDMSFGATSEAISSADATALADANLADAAAGATATATSAVAESAVDTSAATQSVVAPAALAASADPCSYVVTARPQRHTDLLEFHNAAGSDANWAYGTHADTDLQGAIDYSGDGGWLVHGSAHIGNSRSMEIGQSFSGSSAKQNHYVTSDFIWTEGYYKPYYGTRGVYCRDTQIPTYTKSMRATEWVGGVGSDTTTPGSEYIGCANSPQNKHRTTYAITSHLNRTSNNSSSIAGGANVGVIKLSAQSGYSQYVTSYWKAVRHAIWLCGTNYFPDKAGVIHAQNTQ